MIESKVSKYDEAYRQLDKLDFMTAAKILFTEPPRKRSSELLEVKVRLDKLEEAVKEIVVDSKKQSTDNATKNQEDSSKKKHIAPTESGDVQSKSEPSKSTEKDLLSKQKSTGPASDKGKPVTKFDSFTIDERPGEQWVILKRKFARNEEIKGNGDSLEIMCSAWPDTIEITKFFIGTSDKMPAQAYVGPDFKELDDELQDSLYEFLDARGINDELAAFLHEYMKNKDRTEYIKWIGTVKSYIEEK
ncbi:hypothetical protein GH714_000116 [Hevea brasiliensis]|uniref:Mitochondrial glycoprotein family protein n=1 Tax=Hevea brasiliensis TaxID=3981 RepID=A0A6A6NAH2_HEVBR|nr:hypothetical protein GH714_000116 [Hevea brasiliensis]